MKIYSIIVAGGSGTRMKQSIPKQFLLLNGRPILMHTIERFEALSDEIIVVLPKNEMQTWKSLCEKFNFSISIKLIDGGKERFYSVQNAIESIEDSEGIVLVHDGVRPLLSEKLIQHIIDQTQKGLLVIPVYDIQESIRKQENNQNKMVDRRLYKTVQTPQGFHLSKIKKAYQQDYRSEFTDDASVLESIGETITLIEGERFNLKITTPEDLMLAELLINAWT
ncbi:MAG: 2-C-methyl-D-erythritol 4-phosphate cytidylyltransferase [Bacteroidales bacterium]|nr:2-C-methyl-D-erythritol 4-phosphate cytidylyltransferase [Bacteroidales bacterium]